MAEPEPISKVIDSKSDQLIKGSEIKCDTCGSDGHKTEDHGKNGGARKGAGGVPGKLKKKTLVAMKIKEAFNQRIMTHADDLFNAQFQLATGEQVLMVKIKEKDFKGKVLRTYFEQVTDKETIKQYLDYNYADEGEDPTDDEHFFFLSTKPANNQAIDSLMNRALGKVPDKLEVDGGFFIQNELTIKVVGDRHDLIDIGDQGQLEGHGEDSGTDSQQETEPGSSSS